MSVGRCEGSLRGMPITILDVSKRGFKLESRSSLRPGTTCDLNADLDGFRFNAKVQITRCTASNAVPDGRGGRSLVYWAGAAIVGMEKSTAFEEWLGRRMVLDAGSAHQRGKSPSIN